ncbi:MAG: Glycine-tRNA ligase [Parcubacteria group bacterium GW2011_GWD2_38_12]|nr:MAG: Glycine-tRNA ligase [Parcubacteria group bacterium GW2011_GWC2_36_17]KKQ38955.1 MAG: Glycine-tRNA ligase [Candidatus Moranbacteria bacterium GW2011_GWF2_37_7]KKQ52162.1 MAG: Glycine-tRNA ligase [Parcubacteria group bacterium GW2011_GWD2_38_12]KKQ58888.1 MAG: Glycine-tRNA ligase [Parcubacteria group bacterium GW2011_GWC1_38_17]
MTDKTEKSDLMDKIVSLCKRRGFVFPGSEIYGGLANSWDYGPLGVELKNNIKNLWWKTFVHGRDDMQGIDAALIMNPKIWEASGHTTAGFADPMVDCKKCKKRFRSDHLPEDTKICPDCKGELTEPRMFNLMFRTFIGPVEDESALAYLRPETAQAMFVDFKNIIDTMHPKIPFGIAQMGRAFRNEITPGNFIFRTREFEQMEIEYFVREKDWQEFFEYWLDQMHQWMDLIGLSSDKIHHLEVPDGERAHYSKRTVDFEYDFPFGRKELYGIAYRADFDLKNHMEQSGVDLRYFDDMSGERFLPHVIEPTFGVDRTLLAVLSESYTEDEVNGEIRTYLKLPTIIAPYKVAVFPLLANKPQLVEKAREIYNDLKLEMRVAWDDGGNIGKRYRRQDEIGTPYCVTVDFDTIEKDDTVTVRDRDTLEQTRVRASELKNYLREKIK